MLVILAVVVAVAFAAYALAPSGVGKVPSSGVAGQTPDAAVSSQDAEPPLMCSVAKTVCGSVKVSGAGAVSYGVLPAIDASAGLILLEVGGPGANSLARTDRQSLGLPAQMGRYDVLLINEPWVGIRATAACERAMADFANAVAAAGPASGLPVATPCAVPAWTQQSYTQALQAVVDQLNRPLAGIIGHSFGALPAAAAAAVFPQAWLILNAPIAPPGTAGPTVISQRMESVNLALDRSYRTHCAAHGLDCNATGRDVANKAISTMAALPVTGRARPLDKGDFAIALLGSLYGLAENATWLWTVIAKVSNLDTATRSQVARMADQMLMRFGDSQISERLAAFVKGTCGAYSQWTARKDDPRPALDSFFAHVAFQCASGPQAEPNWSVSELRGRQGNVCIFSNHTDPVTPAVWADAWTGLVGRAIAATYTYDGHASLSVGVRAVKDHRCPPLTGEAR